MGNFDFEHQLSGLPPPTKSGSVRRIAAEMASVWMAVAGEEDILWMPEAPDPAYRNEMIAQGFPAVEILSTEAQLTQRLRSGPLICCPWGWDAPIARWAADHQLAIDHPPLFVVKIVNSRRFSFEMEKELDVGLPLATLAGCSDELKRSLAEFAGDSPWVIKSEWGMSARERLLGHGPTLSDSQMNWAEKRFQADESLIIEPWVSAIAEAGLQFDVPRLGEGPPMCLGVTELLTNRSGMYQGSRFDDQVAREHGWPDAIKVGQIVAERAQSLGYFGPLGLDAMRYHGEDGQPQLRPIQDLNARWTMGRLSLGFRRFLHPGEAGVWWHVRCPAKTPESAEAWWTEWTAQLPADLRAIRTSSRLVGQHVTGHVTVLLLTSDAGEIPPLLARLRAMS